MLGPQALVVSPLTIGNLAKAGDPRARARVLGHYGEQDASVPPEKVDELRETIREQTGTAPDLRRYPAGHAFFNDRRPAYEPGSADRAWRDTVAFLHERLG